MAGSLGGVPGTRPVGREAEHRVVATFLDRAAGGPAGLLLAGPAGIGKSTIWRQAIADAEARGFRTLVTRAVEAEAELAFAGLADLLDASFDDVADRLPSAQRHALEVALQRVPGNGMPPPPLAISLGALGAVRALAETRPVVLAVDDLPWLDGPSARVLEFVTRRVAGLRLGFLPTIRMAPGLLHDAALPIELAAPIERLEVGPLDLHEIAELLRRHLGLALPRPDLAWVHGESRGNPFTALELARALRRAGARPGLERPPLPTDTGLLVRARLEALPADARLPLAAVAAMSQPTPQALEAAFPGSEAALQAAREAGLLELEGGRLRFAHPLLASGAYGQLDADERRSLHGRLARAVADPEQRARHLALAAVAPDAAVAAELDRAAEHARACGASDTAAELELQASRLTPPDRTDETRRRILAAAGALITAGDVGRARTILEAHVAGSPPGPGRADALRVLADVRSSDDWNAKLAILGQALEEAGDDHGLRSGILEARSQAQWYLLRSAADSLADATEAVAEAERQDDPAIRCSAYLTTLFAGLNVGGTIDDTLRRRAMELAPRVEHLRVFQWPAFAVALTELQLDRPATAGPLLSDLHRRATELGDWDSLPLITMNLADVAFQQGRWVEARTLARDAVRGSRQIGQLAGLGHALVTLAYEEAALGADEEALAAAHEAIEVAERIGARMIETQARTALGVQALALGDARTAEAELRRAGEPLLAEGYLGPFLANVLADWAEALAGLGRPTEALALLDRHEPGVRRREQHALLAAVLRSRGLATAAAGDDVAADAAFAEALGLQGATGEPFGRARTLLARGEALRRTRQRGRAREALAEAVSLFEALSAPRWLARAQAELGRTGHRTTGAQLSPTEQQVAELVAAGRTNREVADALFMSPHTVEAHLTRVYRSLGVRGRTELAVALAARSTGRTGGPEADPGGTADGAPSG